MQSHLTGTWSLQESENFDEYMKAVGVGQITRMAAKFLKPEMTIAQEGDVWTIKSTSSLKNHEFTFTPGQEFELTTADGRQVKATLHFEGENKLVHIEKGKVDSTITREATDADNIYITLEAPGVVCKRHYTRKS